MRGGEKSLNTRLSDETRVSGQVEDTVGKFTRTAKVSSPSLRLTPGVQELYTYTHIKQISPIEVEFANSASIYKYLDVKIIY